MSAPMKQAVLIPLLAALAATSAAGQDAKKPSPSPGEIVAAAPAQDWVDIAADDLLVMTLAPDARGKPRRVIIQLIPAPFSQGWVANIRTLARAHWYDGNAIYRVQDNYVTQWGDPNGDDATKAKKLPDGLKAVPEGDYVVSYGARDGIAIRAAVAGEMAMAAADEMVARLAFAAEDSDEQEAPPQPRDSYAERAFIAEGWPAAAERKTGSFWPVHCYGAVGVSRGQSPDTGNGSALYAVNGHAPRHLDRNIAVVGRIVEGMEFLSSLPRGTEALGFYKDEADYVPILSVRLVSELPAAERPRLQYLDTNRDSFTRYADARANRRDPFFIVPAGGADICNIPVPIRRKP